MNFNYYRFCIQNNFLFAVWFRVVNRIVIQTLSVDREITEFASQILSFLYFFFGLFLLIKLLCLIWMKRQLILIYLILLRSQCVDNIPNLVFFLLKYSEDDSLIDEGFFLFSGRSSLAEIKCANWNGNEKLKTFCINRWILFSSLLRSCEINHEKVLFFTQQRNK